MHSSLLLLGAFMTGWRLLLVLAASGCLLAVRAAGAHAQTDDAASLGMSYPGAPRAESERGPAPRHGVDAGTGDEVTSGSGGERRAPCDQIISRYDSDPSGQHGHVVDISAIARELHTSVIWVERCMLASGKRVNHSHLQSVESAEDRLEALEEDEPEESAPEEIDAGPEPKEHEEVPRVLKNPSKRIPTPGTGYESPD